MRFIIYGAGGVGGVIGAQLFKAGQDVVLIARGDHLRAMQSAGLRYQTPYADEYLRIPALSHPSELTLKASDVVMLTCKSQHTQSALDDLRAAHGTGLPVVCCQNSVVNEHMALRRFTRVYAMLVYLPAQLTEPGTIQCHAKLKSGVLDLGLFPNGVDELARALAERLEAVNFSARPDPQVMRFKYAKLLVNLNNALEAVSPGGSAAQGIRDRIRAEGEACLDAAGIDYASRKQVEERRAGVFEFGDIAGVARIGGSSKQSLLRGTGDIEADYLNGEVVRLGRLHGVATPANAVVQRLAVAAAAKRQAPGAVPVAHIEKLIEEAARAEFSGA
ncbi:MAG: ketopantoate reductase family protein [Gammaproteobacteria bacterium]|nr:ketopantoate reductase family protein [Gammaproteobacteria bacterium]